MSEYTVLRALASVRGLQTPMTPPKPAQPSVRRSRREPAESPVPPTGAALEMAAALCRRFEGLHLKPYICPAGVATVGLGSICYEDGTPVRMTDPPISVGRAEALLMRDLRVVRMPAVLKLCPGANTPGRLAALIDFAYNLGNGALASSTLRKRVNAGQWDLVPAELKRWNRGGGRVLRGLVLRREAEVALLGR